MTEAYEKARQKILDSKVEETTQLNLMFERIEKIPPEVTRLTKLEVLNLHDTKINDLSPIAGMTSLRQLTCGSNPLADMSPLRKLVNLEKLYLNHCRVTDLSIVGDLPVLSTLDVRDNRVKDIGVLSGCKQLKYVDISNNLVTSLRPLRHMLERKITLKTRGAFWATFYGSVIIVKGCPLEDPPLTIADRGTQSVLNYWIVQDQKQRSKDGVEPAGLNHQGRAAVPDALRQEIQDALVRNDFAKAFTLLAKAREDISGWQGRWNALNRDVADGVISDVDFRKEENIIRRALLKVTRNL
jgi:hypothetical protein